MWGATAHIVPARVLGFAQRLLLIDAPSAPTLFRLAFPGFWVFWVWVFWVWFSTLSWPAGYPHRRKRCTECCHHKRNDELDGPQVATNQGAQTSQGQADKQEDGDEGEGGGQGAVQRCSLPGAIDGIMCVNT